MKTITLENPEGLQQLFLKKNWSTTNFNIKVLRDKDETVLVDTQNSLETAIGNSVRVSLGSTLAFFLNDPTDKIHLGWSDIPGLGLLLSINGRDEFLHIYKSAEKEAILRIGSTFPTLKIIDFGSAQNQTIQTLDCLIGCQNLDTLNINSCSNLKDIASLPYFKELKTLWMNDFAEWSQLSNISKCTKLMELRHRRGKLKSLKHLEGLVHLEYCDVSENDFVKLFPVSGLTSLKKLYLNNCKNLIEANAFTEFTSLTHLGLSECKNLNLIESLSGLNYLSHLYLKKTNISNLPTLSNINSLNHLDLSECKNLVNVASISSQISLNHLDFSYCEKLANISPLSTLSSLTQLNLKGCRSITDLTPISGLKNLTYLNLDSTSIKNLAILSELIALKNLDLSSKYLTDLSGLSNLHSLIELNLNYNPSLENLAPLSELKILKHLKLKRCNSIRDLTPLSELKALENLDLSECENIRELSPLSELKLLENLDLSQCNLSDIPALSGLILLKKLKITSCKNLKYLTGLSNLHSLIELDLSTNQKIVDLTPISGLHKLNRLDLGDCKNISDLAPLGQLTNLTNLNLCFYNKIIDISPLSKLKSLTTIDLSFCTNLSDISPLSHLTSLSSINLYGLEKLKLVKSLGFLPNLRDLDLRSCPHVRDIEKLYSLNELRVLGWENPIVCDQILMQSAYNRKDPGYIIRFVKQWINRISLSQEPSIYISKLLQCISLLDNIEQKAHLLSSIDPMRTRGLDHPDKVNELEAASWTHWCALATALPVDDALECLYAAVNNLDIVRETEVLLGSVIEAAAELLIEHPNQREHLRTWVEAQLHHLEAYPEQKRQIAPSVAFFYATLHQDDQVRLWLKIATDEKAPHWRDKVLAALVNYHAGHENFEEARQILTEIQIQEIKDGASNRLAEAMAVKYPIDAGFLLDAIQSLDIRITAAKKLLTQPTMLVHPQGIYQLLLNLQDDPDALADCMELLIRQDQEGATVRMIQTLFQNRTNNSATVFLDLCAHPALLGFVKRNKLEDFKKRLTETHEREKAAQIPVFLDKLQQEGLIEEAEVLELAQLMQA